MKKGIRMKLVRLWLVLAVACGTSQTQAPFKLPAWMCGGSKAAASNKPPKRAQSPKGAKRHDGGATVSPLHDDPATARAAKWHGAKQNPLASSPAAREKVQTRTARDYRAFDADYLETPMMPTPKDSKTPPHLRKRTPASGHDSDSSTSAL